jgi:dihydropteroate synthase
VSLTLQSWRLKNTELDLSRGILMGVLNVTPDSFSDGGRFYDETAAISHGLEMASQGAQIIDVGGESTRPGSGSVPPDVERQRVVPVVSALAGEGVTVSIDTSKPSVAEAALVAGAQVVNDVTACSESGMIDLVAAAGCGLVLMHMQGKPRDMQVAPSYQDVVGEVERFLVERMSAVSAGGVETGRVAIDPGIGFGKTFEHNLELLRNLDRLSAHAPVVLGTSRKSFLGALTGVTEPEQRDLATAVTTAVGFLHGVRVFRVHDVPSSRQALAVAGAMVAGGAPS